jgi:FkbM family methyltransferase
MSKLISVLSRIYLLVFGSKMLQRINDALLTFTLRARGYNNYDDARVSGEQFFIAKVLTRLDPKVCIDVGANVGSYSARLLRMTNAMVYAFEPLSEPFSQLTKFEQKFGGRFIAVNKGVGAKDETLTMHFNPKATEHASFSEEVKDVPYVENRLSQDVEVITLDTFFLGNFDRDGLDFLKIDTEGFEYEVLCGAQRTIATHKPKMIQIEYNWHQLFKRQTLYSFATLLAGYQVFQMLPNRLVRRDPADPHCNIYHYSNFVFIRDDLVHMVEI